jgi:peptidoglycan hydrolase-like protein with peptidoglycan-binding domain
VVGAIAVLAILINVLFMQSGSHPAPMFSGASTSAKQSVAASARPVEASSGAVSSAAPTPPARSPAPVPVRSPGEIINDIQRELARRGYYDGPLDGVYGPKTDGAIREFENAAGLKPGGEPGEALLQAVMRAPAKVLKAAPVPTPALRPPMPVRNDAAVERPAPSRRVLALQRALAEYGYGQLKPTGMVDAETQSAIERFERERKLPVTGQPSDRVARELAAMTGRALE